MSKQRGLGRGLDALFPGMTEQTQDQEGVTYEVAIQTVIPNKSQPRRVFDEEALADLAQSIKQHGVLQPIMVRKIIDGYELVAGERRWRASQMAGLKTIPAVVREFTDAEMTEIALIENLQRENLNPIEEALAYRRLMDEFGFTQEEVARKIGRSRSLIANMVRLLQLHPDVQQHLWQGTLTNGQVRPLLALEDPDLQIEAASQIVEEGLSAREVEDLVRKLLNRRVRHPAVAEEVAEVPLPVKAEEERYFLGEVEDRLKLILGTQVRIKTGKQKSKIEIEFYSPEDLERLLETLTALRQETVTEQHQPPERLVV